MILEIHYRGKTIKEVEMPDGTNIEGLKFSARVESKMNKANYIDPVFIERPIGRPEPWNKGKKITQVKNEHKNKGKTFVKDKPLVKIPEKDPVKYEKPKAVYSNSRPYDFYYNL